MRCDDKVLGWALVAAIAVVWAGGVLAADRAKPAVSGASTKTPDATSSPAAIVPATEEEAAAAIERAHKFAEAAGAELKIEFATLETPHFIIFTDWDPREYAFLKENVENAYTVVAKQFELSPKDNVFVGKLPIFMITANRDFRRFAQELSKMSDPPKGLAGYYTGRTDGWGYMVMWKPDLAATRGDVRAAEREWAHVLVHEFTHAFVARYRSTRVVPRWLGEGVAEVIAGQNFPRAYVHEYVRRLALQGKGIGKMYGDRDFASFTAEDYPFAQTVVETMVAGDARAFLRYFNDIKDGMDPDQALFKEYHTDVKGLEQAWRKYLKQNPQLN